MLTAVILFIVPVLLFVLAFLYETYVSFRRLWPGARRRDNYLSATWEVTHTLLVFAVVMLIMLFTQRLADLAAAIFLSTFLAAVALGVRAVFYVYIFYARPGRAGKWAGWVFALSHVAAALLLVLTVIRALLFLYRTHPPVNSQFVPYFLPGLAVVLLLCAVPLLTLYRTKD